MTRRHDIVADGISLVSPNAFQSFITRIYSIKHFKSFRVPAEVVKHLNLEPDDILEVAIRKVTKEYVAENYNFRFISFKTICPTCKEEGRLQLTRWGTYVMFHKHNVTHSIPVKIAQQLQPI